ncbi:RAD51-associated protein 2 [Trachemys scripta elegans]|uniref:RAD51-associated protein 2 n=1 Tax=Trachemys scripta elegans TaxID=31138 RepID=UPI001554ADF2|nr:RAD51-associated protein 2 [Trachemys scripta elegans]
MEEFLQEMDGNKEQQRTSTAKSKNEVVPAHSIANTRSNDKTSKSGQKLLVDEERRKISLTAISSKYQIFLRMKGLCYKTFLSMSSNEADGYPYPKRIKIENNHTSVEKEEQPQLEQRTYLVDECRKSSSKPIYLSEGSLHFSQNAWRLEKEISGRERKTNLCEFIDFKPWTNEKLQCRLLENKLFTKKWNIENEEHNIIRDDSLLNVNGHSSEAGLYHLWNVNKTSNNIAAVSNKTDNDSELTLNASLSSLNTDLFQVKTSSQKIGTDNKWKEHQLLDVPFLCGINSTFSEIKNKDRNNCLKKLPTEENKDHYGNESESVEQLSNKEKNASSHTFPTLKLFKNIQTFKIPQTNFFMKGNISKCSTASNTLNSNMLSTNLKEIEQKNFKHQTYVMQSEKIYCSQNISLIRKQKFQNDKNIVNTASVCSEFYESNHQSVNKQKTLALAEEGEKITETNLRNNINSVKCNQMFAKRIVEEKELGNAEGDEDQEPNIYLSVHTYFGSKTPQSDECINSTNILKRTWGKVSYEDVTFNIQETTVPLISEVLRNRDLNINYDMHCANCNRNLHESELKLSTTKILDIKRYLSKSILTEGNCPYSTTQDLPDTRDNILKQKKLTKLKIFFHDMLLGGLKTRPGSLNKDVLKYQENDSIIGWFHLYEKLKSIEQYSIPELITSINKNSTHIYLQVTVSEQQNVNPIKSDLAFFPYNINCLHPAEEKCIPVEKNPFYCRKQVKRNSHINNSLKGNTESQQKYTTYREPLARKTLTKKSMAVVENCKKNCCSSLPKIPFFSIFDTYEKIPLSTDSEEMDQIPLVRQINPNNEKYIEESTVASIKNIHNVPAKSDVCILPELSTTSIVNGNSELLPDSRNSQHLENEIKYVHFLNTGFNYGNIFHCFLDNGQCSTLPFSCGPFTDKDVVLKTEEGHCRSSLSDDTKKLCEEMNSILQYQIVRSSEVSNNKMYFKVQREETMTFSLDEDIQKDRNFCTLNSKPMTIKQNLEDLQAVGEISSGQHYITNKNQHQTILHGSRSTNLILSYSKDESAICVASGDKLIPHLSIMDNGCFEDMTDQHLPSESKNIFEFEMKSKFDLVLEELCMFHEISKEHENKLSKVERNTIQENPQELNNSEGIDENLKSVSQTKVCISFPIYGTAAGQNITKNNQSSCKGKILNRNVKQKVPHEFCSSSVSDEELLYSLSEEDYVDSGCKNRFPWDPVFLSHTFMKERRDGLQKERGNYLSHEIIRVQPLKTCSGPIRIGLSRKAKPKKLHPYLK